MYSKVIDDKLSENVSISTPYFFSRDRLIVLYVGTDESTLETLTGILGPALTGPQAS
jgi:hypothetical protein